MSKRLACFVWIFCLIDFCHTLQDDPHYFDHGGHSLHDYIIIGGGTAGCALAATLSQKYNVLLIERGGSPYGNPNITKIENVVINLSDTSPSSPSQPFTSEDGVFNNRGRVLGGSTAINGGFYSRASKEYITRAGWYPRLVTESYMWVEEALVHKPNVVQWQSAVMDGLLEAGLTPDNGFTYEHLNGTKVGGTIFDENGTRHTAADLLSRYADPKRLSVVLNATVSQILFHHNGIEKPNAYGVVYRDSTGRRLNHTVYLKKDGKGEIIVSAGAIGSPQLLMLSGIGPKKQLQKFGIQLILDHPMVGQHICDLPQSGVYIPSPSPVDISTTQVVGIIRQRTYIEALSGFNFPGFTYNPEGEGSTVNNVPNLASPTFPGGLLFEKITKAKSRGHMELRSRNPDDTPKVTYNYFSDPSDLRKCVVGLEILERTLASKGFAKFRYPFLTIRDMFNLTASVPKNLIPINPNAASSFEQYCKATVTTVWHFHGGCEVHRVVDRDYKVLGVDALRVVDGSTFKFSPGTNPQATVMMLGRYVGVKILEVRNTRK